jgi:hypothetical protein
VQVVLEQIDRLRDDVGQKEDELKQAKKQRNRPVRLSITHKLSTDDSSQFDVR